MPMWTAQARAISIITCTSAGRGRPARRASDAGRGRTLLEAVPWSGQTRQGAWDRGRGLGPGTADPRSGLGRAARSRAVRLGAKYLASLGLSGL